MDSADGRDALTLLRAEHRAYRRHHRGSRTLRRAVIFYSRAVPGWIYIPSEDAVEAAPSYCAPAWTRPTTPERLREVWDASEEVPF